MKPVPLAIGILGCMVLIGASVAIKNEVQLKRDGEAITKLIAEYKAMGVPTNGDELVRKIPDSENAWIEIEPYLVERTKGGARIVFKSALALDLMMVGTKNDLPLIDKYLAENKATRDAIDAALNSKINLQVTHNYNEGYMMLLPEFAALRPLVREYCLAAYSASLHGDIEGVERNLESANRFASDCIGRPEYISAVSGAAYRRNIYTCVLRIVEVNPALASRLQKFIMSPQFHTVVNREMVFRSEFIAQLSIPRSFDFPEIDRVEMPAFMKSIVKVRDESDINALAHTREGDYMPASRTMRSYLRNRLESWKPFFQSLKKDIPPINEYLAASDMGSIPKQLLFLMPQGSSDASYIYRGVGTAQKYSDINRAIWSAMNRKASSGHYPETLEDTGVAITHLSPDDIDLYDAGIDHVLIRASQGTPNYDDPQPSLSFPVNLATTAKTNAQYVAQVKKYRKGEILFNGSSAKSIPPARSPRSYLKP